MPAPVTPEELEIPFEKPAEEAPTLHVDSHPDGPPAEVEAPTEEAPVEEAPTEEAPVEEALTGEAPTEEAPVEEAPTEEATPEDG